MSSIFAFSYSLNHMDSDPLITASTEYVAVVIMIAKFCPAYLKVAVNSCSYRNI